MKKIGLIISIFFFLAATIFLSHYGPNWDEPNHFYRGEAYLHYFLTGQKDYKELPPVPRYYQKDDELFFNPGGTSSATIYRRSMFMNNQITFNYWMKNDGGHPPLSDIIASVFNLVLFQKLGFINDVDSFHVYSVLLAALLVGAIFFWVSKKYGKFAGMVSALSLSLYPMFWAESHFNIKDIPEAVFYSLSLLFFYEAIINKKNKWVILSSIFFGLAFATKFNAVFIPFTIIPWLFVYLYSRRDNLKKYLSLLPSFIAYPFIPIIIFFACWPFLWQAPFKNFLSVVDYYNSIGNNSSFDPRYLTIFGINTYAIQWIIYTTPLIILFFSVIGVLVALFKGSKEKDKTLIFVLLWLVIPILRVTRPNAGIYGGVRQIMEYVPAMAILSGIGALFLRDKILPRLKFFEIKKEIILSCVFLLFFVPIALKLISIHPNEDMYFNPLIGGLEGAVNNNFPDWGNSLGNQYRAGIRWINQNADKNSKITIDSGLGSNIADNLLRTDLTFTVLNRSAIKRKGEYIIGLVNTGFEDSYFEKYLNRFLIPVHEEKVDGVSVLKIWKNDLAHTRNQYKNETLLTENPSSYVTGNTLFIDFGEIYSMAEVEMQLGGSCVKDLDGSVQVSSDAQSWETLDNSLNSQFLIPFSSYQDNNQFVYYLAADDGRYMEFNFTSDKSCFKSVKAIKLYGFKD